MSRFDVRATESSSFETQYSKHFARSVDDITSHRSFEYSEYLVILFNHLLAT